VVISGQYAAGLRRRDKSYGLDLQAGIATP